MRFNKQIVMGVGLVLALAGFALADSIDEAEAKRRGVSVETVLLEKARTRIGELEKKVVELQTKLAAADVARKIAESRAMADGTPAAKTPTAVGGVTASPPATQPETGTAKAIREHRLVKGMTLDEVKAALPGEWLALADRDGLIEYECTVVFASLGRVLDSARVATATFQDGKLVYWDVQANAQQRIEEQAAAIKACSVGPARKP